MFEIELNCWKYFMVSDVMHGTNFIINSPSIHSVFVSCMNACVLYMMCECVFFCVEMWICVCVTCLEFRILNIWLYILCMHLHIDRSDTVGWHMSRSGEIHWDWYAMRINSWLRELITCTHTHPYKTHKKEN